MLANLGLQLFWLSFAIIGLCPFLIYRRFYRHTNFGGVFYGFVGRSHSLVALLVCFAIGFGVFAVPVAIGYVFKWPLWVFEIVYFTFLATAVCALISDWQLLSNVLVKRYRQMDRRQTITLVVFLLLLVFEYVLSMSVGASLNDDTPLHLSKIQLMLNLRHLSLADPFTGYNGVLDLRYSTNLLNGLQAVAGSVLHLSADKIWAGSFAFYRLLLELSIFSLAKVFLGMFIPKQWPYYTMLLVPYFGFTYVFDYPELPHGIALVWTSLLLIGLKLLFTKNSYGLLAVSILLTAVTHVIPSTYTALFLGMLLVALLILRRLTRKQAAVIIACIGALAVPVIASSLQPSRSTQLVLSDTTAHGFHVADISVKREGPVVLPKITLLDPGYYHAPKPIPLSFIIDPWALPACVLVAGYVVLLKRLKSPKSKRISLVLIIIAVLGVFNSLYISTVSYIYLISKAKNKRVKIMLALTVMFFALVAYDPLFLTVVFGRIPLWLVVRFQELNTFSFVAPLLGVFILFRFIAKYWDIGEMASGEVLFIVMLIAGIALYRFPLNTARITALDNPKRLQNLSDQKILENLRPVGLYIDNRVMYTNDGNVHSFLPIVASGQIGEVMNIQSNQQNNLKRRVSCNDRLDSNLQLADLTAAHVTRVVIRYDSHAPKNEQRIAKLASTKTYLQPLLKTRQYIVYNVVASASRVKTNSSMACAIPYKQ